MGWFGNSDKTAPPPGREIVAMLGVKIDSDYIYYLGVDGDVWRKNDTGTELVTAAGVSKEDGYYYFIDSSGGNVCRIPVAYDMSNPDHPNRRVDLNILHLDGMMDKAEMNSIAEGEAIIDKKIEEYAKESEKNLDYQKAIELYESIDMPEEAARVRKLKAEQGAVKVDQTVVQGDLITKTEIKDSVVNKSNIGAGGKSKAEEIKEIKELLDSGAIDDDEFKQMKKEILGK